MRIHDQLHPQTQTSTREIYDEQRTGELHYTTGKQSERQNQSFPRVSLKSRLVEAKANRALEANIVVP